MRFTASRVRCSGWRTGRTGISANVGGAQLAHSEQHRRRHATEPLHKRSCTMTPTIGALRAALRTTLVCMTFAACDGPGDGVDATNDLSVPANVTAQAVSATEVDLSW